MFQSHSCLRLLAMCWWLCVLPLRSTAGQDPIAVPEAANHPATHGRVYRLTLEEAQRLSGGIRDPLLRIAELQEEAARQRRLGAQADYFPKVTGLFANLHFNKPTNGFLTVLLPGRIITESVNVFFKDQTMFDFSVLQPVTPLFSIHQRVIMARADETMAKLRKELAASETMSRVEKTYFDLLIAQYELDGAEADAKETGMKWPGTPDLGLPQTTHEQELEVIKTERAVGSAVMLVKELTATLNGILGLPDGTTLELVHPDPLVEDVSFQEITEKAMVSNPEIVKAEQIAVKARAGAKLAKMAYFPSVSVIGGYVNQNTLNVFPEDASYIGFVASYNVFDFGKRERVVKDRRAQLAEAEMALQLTKSKVAAMIRSSFLELERSRRLSQMVRRMSASGQPGGGNRVLNRPETESARARLAAEMLRVELEHRQAFRRLQELIGVGENER